MHSTNVLRRPDPRRPPGLHGDLWTLRDRPREKGSDGFMACRARHTGITNWVAWVGDQRMMLIAVYLAVALAVLGCTSPAGTTTAVATFEVDGERFRATATDASTIDVLRRLLRREEAPSIPNGRLIRGSGNEPWTWRLEGIQMADVAIEACDGRPSYVEAHLDEFLAIGRYCPWAARLVSLELR